MVVGADGMVFWIVWRALSSCVQPSS